MTDSDMTSQDFRTEKQKEEIVAKEAANSELSLSNLESLPLRTIIGFNGSISKGLIVHPSCKHILFPVGRNIVIEDITTEGKGQQVLLSRHTDDVSALAVSKDGRFVASGQQIAMGYKALTILWDFCSRQVLMEWPLHKVRVEAVAFALSSKFFMTLGGIDDGCVVVWDVSKKEPVCGMPAQISRAPTTTCLATSGLDDTKFVTAGNSYGRIWQLDCDDRKLSYTELAFGPFSRVIISIEVVDAANTEMPMVFCGTTTGDILVFNFNTGKVQAAVPAKRLEQGVTTLTFVRMLDDSTFNMLVGTGDGKVVNYNVTLTYEKGGKVKSKATLESGTVTWSEPREPHAITSISKLGAGHTFYVGTRSNQIYRFNLLKWVANLIRTCSNNPILALTFARATDDIMLIGEYEKVRVFNLSISLEVRSYVRTNRTCHSVVVSHDGTQVFTGWDNGETIVLGFEPKSLGLKEIYRMDSGQRQAVTALALTSQSAILLSAGREGQMRAWRLVDDLDGRGQRLRQGLLLHIFAAQSGPISAIQISQDDQTCICASHDGSVVLYNIPRGVTKGTFRLHSPILSASLCSQELQLLTSSSDGNIHYWEIVTQDFLREVRGVKHGSVHSVDVSGDSRHFVSGGDDTMVKLWDFDSGEVTHVGRAHSDAVCKVKFGPCGTVIVSAAKDGSICIWDKPKL